MPLDGTWQGWVSLPHPQTLLPGSVISKERLSYSSPARMVNLGRVVGGATRGGSYNADPGPPKQL